MHRLDLSSGGFRPAGWSYASRHMSPETTPAFDPSTRFQDPTFAPRRRCFLSQYHDLSPTLRRAESCCHKVWLNGAHGPVHFPATFRERHRSSVAARAALHTRPPWIALDDEYCTNSTVAGFTERLWATHFFITRICIDASTAPAPRRRLPPTNGCRLTSRAKVQ